MGHQRLGKLPAHRLLPEIVRYLVTGGTPTGDLVAQVTEFGQEALNLAQKDPVFTEAMWLLVRIPQAVGSRDPENDLEALGLPAAACPSVTDVLVAYDAALERVQRQSHAGTTDLGEIARHAGLAALGEAIQNGLPSLWAPTAEDVRASISVLRGTEKFAAMAQRFYSNFIERVIHYYVDRNLHHLVGPDRVAKSVHDLRSFNEAIRRHCNEAALIMRAFARDWLGKNLYRDAKQVAKDDIRRFSGYAVQKIRIELDQRKGAP